MKKLEQGLVSWLTTLILPQTWTVSHRHFMLRHPQQEEQLLSISGTAGKNIFEVYKMYDFILPQHHPPSILITMVKS